MKIIAARSRSIDVVRDLRDLHRDAFTSPDESTSLSIDGSRRRRRKVNVVGCDGTTRAVS